MDWARDDEELSDHDLHNVFKYEPKQCTVVKIVESGRYEAQVWALETHDDWLDWIEDEIQSMHSSERGVILILARRSGERSISIPKSNSIEAWLDQIRKQIPENSATRHAHTFAPLEEKNSGTVADDLNSTSSGQRGVRTLPFSLATFKILSQCLNTHGSIARVISRADVPLFSAEKVCMGGEPAFVYNCRTPNAWATDLALSATHFPRAGMTFSIVYGCTLSLEERILKRLQRGRRQPTHPFLLPAIFAELELSRHIRLIESAINKVEAKIFQLSFQLGDLQKPRLEVEKQNEDKRTAWLDLAYLRNALVSWNTQLDKMVAHCEELNYTPPDSTRNGQSRSVCLDCHRGLKESSPLLSDSWSSSFENAATVCENDRSPISEGTLEKTNLVPNEPMNNITTKIAEPLRDPEIHKELMNVIGVKIRSRLLAMKDEYDEKIRDCTMRMDGMAMATQWSYGETNVEIALATSQDSRVMRSIALVTMVFLPGTFLAAVFSMTFFDWSGEGGKTRVSSYLWIYITITAVFTLLTVGSWYFLVLHRRQHKMAQDTESEPLV